MILRFGTAIGNWEMGIRIWGLGLEIVICDWDRKFGLGIGIRDRDLALGFGELDWGLGSMIGDWDCGLGVGIVIGM